MSTSAFTASPLDINVLTGIDATVNGGSALSSGRSTPKSWADEESDDESVSDKLSSLSGKYLVLGQKLVSLFGETDVYLSGASLGASTGGSSTVIQIANDLGMVLSKDKTANTISKLLVSKGVLQVRRYDGVHNVDYALSKDFYTYLLDVEFKDEDLSVRDASVQDLSVQIEQRSPSHKKVYASIKLDEIPSEILLRSIKDLHDSGVSFFTFSGIMGSLSAALSLKMNLPKGQSYYVKETYSGEFVEMCLEHGWIQKNLVKTTGLMYEFTDKGGVKHHTYARVNPNKLVLPTTLNSTVPLCKENFPALSGKAPVWSVKTESPVQHIVSAAPVATPASSPFAVFDPYAELNPAQRKLALRMEIAAKILALDGSA